MSPLDRIERAGVAEPPLAASIHAVIDEAVASELPSLLSSIVAAWPDHSVIIWRKDTAGCIATVQKRQVDTAFIRQTDMKMAHAAGLFTLPIGPSETEKRILLVWKDCKHEGRYARLAALVSHSSRSPPLEPSTEAARKV
jgi:hypothetical protein